MGESKPEAPPKPNGGVKQKPTTLNLASGTSFYRPTANGQANLNDRHLLQQQQQHAAGDIGLNRPVRSNSISRFESAVANNSAYIGNESNHAQLSALSAVYPVLSGLSAKSSLSPAAKSSWSALASEYEERDSPPPPTPASSHPATPLNIPGINGEHAQQQLNINLQSPSIGQLSTHSPNHNGFSLYTPPAPIPASGANKVRSVPNGLPQPAPRRPHSIAAPPYHLTALQSITAAFAGRTVSPAASSQQQSSYPWIGAINNLAPLEPTAPDSPRCTRDFNVTNSQVIALSKSQHQKHDASPACPNLNTIQNRNAVPQPASLCNGKLQQQQHLARTPHDIAPTLVSTTCSSESSSSTSSVSSTQSSAAVVSTTSSTTGVQSSQQPPPSVRTPNEPMPWGITGMMSHQVGTRRSYASTLPHPHSPIPTSQVPTMNVLTSPGNCQTWTSGVSMRTRPHSIACTPQGSTSPTVAASPSDSGYRSLPSASSDYQLMSKSPSLQQQNQAQNQSAARRLSLPSAQCLLKVTAPRPSPTFHGLPFKPFTCGVSPNGNPIFLGCTHSHGSTGNTNSTSSSTGSIRNSPSITSPASVFNTVQAIQQLLAQQKNGLNLDGDKLSLFIDILDTQERFAKVSIISPNS